MANPHVTANPCYFDPQGWYYLVQESLFHIHFICKIATLIST